MSRSRLLACDQMFSGLGLRVARRLARLPARSDEALCLILRKVPPTAALSPGAIQEALHIGGSWLA